MVTSSSTLAPYGAIGAGIPAASITDVVTVVKKAYSFSSWCRAFVSEIFGDEADELSNLGGDGGEIQSYYRTSRRMGWFDAVVTSLWCKNAQGHNRSASKFLMYLDILMRFQCALDMRLDGKITMDFPTTPQLEKAKPVLKTMPGWKSMISEELLTMKNFLSSAVTILRLLSRKLKPLSQWYLMVLEDMRLSTERVNFSK